MTSVLLLSGSTRAGSTNTALLRTAAAVVPPGVRTTLFGGLRDLPAFDPDADRDPLPAPVARLRAALAATDALLVCTPEYAGGMPGSLKNLLDWTVGGTEMNGRPVGWVNVAMPPRGERTHEALGVVLSYVEADVDAEACTRIPVQRGMVGEDGLVADADVRAGVRAVLAALAARVALSRSAEPSPGG